MAGGDRAFECVRIVRRPRKPRERGLTYVRDVGLSTVELRSVLESAGDYIDILKLGAFSPRLQSRELIARKVELCRAAGVEVGLGGVMLELAVLQGPRVVYQLLDEVTRLGIRYVEVSRSLAILSVDHLAALVTAVQRAGLRPIAEVGVAYGIGPDDPVDVDERRVIATMARCLEAGAWKVLLESEGLTESRHPDEFRWDVVSTVAHAFPLDSLMFEADDPLVWNRYVYDLGPEVNLFVDHSRVLRLEASRLGGWAQPQKVVNRVATFYPDHPEIRDEGR
jgi:phosphosulfolactate synthase (CoM biosynthesis protein A)